MSIIIQTGEQKVKLSEKMVKKLKGFQEKVNSGLENVKYVPEAKFVKAKDMLKNLFKKTKKEETKKKEIVKQEEKQITKVLTTEKSAPEQEKENKEESKQKEDDKNIKEIKGKPIAALKKEKKDNPVKEESETKQENAPAKAVEIEVPAKEIKQEEKQPEQKKEKRNLDDLTEFATYKEYKYAYFWNHKINKYDAEILEIVAKDLAKEADINQFKTILTEAEFNEKKAKQIKTKEIAEIKKNHKEELAQAEKKRQTDVQEAIDKRQAEIDNLNEKLETARSKNRTITAKLKVTTKSLKQIQEKADLVGIQTISDIIKTANEKCEGIDERAKERAKAKENSPEQTVVKNEMDTKVDEIMNGINNKVYGEKIVETQNKTPQIEPQKNEENEKPIIIEKNEETNMKIDNSLMNELETFDEKEPEKVSIFDTQNLEPSTAVNIQQNEMDLNWKTTPITSQEETNHDFNMGFDSETRAQIGQEAFKRMVESNNKMTFEEAKNQVASEYATQSKGRTK